MCKDFWYLYSGHWNFWPVFRDCWCLTISPLWVAWRSHFGHWNFRPICTDFSWLTWLSFWVTWYSHSGLLNYWPLFTDCWCLTRSPFELSHFGHWNFRQMCTDFWWRLPFELPDIHILDIGVFGQYRLLMPDKITFMSFLMITLWALIFSPFSCSWEIWYL